MSQPKVMIRLVSFATLTLVLLLCVNPTDANAEAQATQLHDESTIAVMARDSVPSWPNPLRAPKDAPNIVVILLDDIGFGDASTFGGVALTPELDRLAQVGLRYNNFHVTGMCSPTRAALLTGHNHHRVGFGSIADAAGGYPGYNSIWKESTASVAEVLRQSGYSTSAFGKWHNTPDWEITPTGPFDRWPTGRGFEYFYGFMGPAGAENHWEPTKLYRNTLPVDAPRNAGGDYHLTTDLVDDAIGWLRQHQSLSPEKPYFLFLAPGAVHIPHHTPRKWIDQYRGLFDAGWDALNEQIFDRQKRLGVIPKDAARASRPKEVPAWTSLPSDQKRLYARQMEVYAGFISHTDHEIGRLLAEVRSGPQSDNTLVFYVVGDNGPLGASGALDGYASGAAEFHEHLSRIDELGGPKVPMNAYSFGWTWVGSTPFQYHKMIASHLGGIRNPLIVSWPARIRDGGAIRGQFTHVNGIVGTIYDAIGVKPPSQLNRIDQQPLDGSSFLPTFFDSKAPSQHRVQYFEMLGNRAIYADGWLASARHNTADLRLLSKDDFEQDKWELYNLERDFSQSRDLAQVYPLKLQELKELFDREARRNGVYPLGGALSEGKPSLTAQRTEFLLPANTRVAIANVPRLGQTAFSVSAEGNLAPGDTDGVLLKCGDRVDGFVFYVKDRRLVFESISRNERVSLTSPTSLRPGQLNVGFGFVPEGGDPKDSERIPRRGHGHLSIDGRKVAESKMLSSTCRGGTGDPDIFVGRQGGSPVSESPIGDFASSHALRGVTLRVPRK